jgi:putative two-component system response regulator
MKSKKIILVVEDQKENIAMLHAILGDLYTLRIALDGEKALVQVNMLQPDLILLDVMLPGISGYDVCRVLKGQDSTRDIPIIFVTGLTAELNEEVGLRLGGSDYIFKPYSPGLMKSRIQIQFELLEHRNTLERMIAERTAQLTDIKDALFESMSIMISYRDKVTGSHVQRTRKYMELLLDFLSEEHPEGALIDDQMKKYMSQATLMHDIGKVAMPDTLLIGEGRLSEDDYEYIKRHTLLGREILQKAKENLSDSHFLSYAQDMATYHHERWDGTGYPMQLKGEEIPLAARVMALIDVYDALTGERPYKPAMTHSEAMGIIMQGDPIISANHFDPAILSVFVAHEGAFASLNAAMKQDERYA